MDEVVEEELGEREEMWVCSSVRRRTWVSGCLQRRYMAKEREAAVDCVLVGVRLWDEKKWGSYPAW